MNTKNQNQNANPNTAPVHTARAGTVNASVWETATENGLQFKVIISRMFKKDESWQRGHTFYADNLAAVVEAVGKAQQWIERRQRELQAQPQNP
jgi:hypothetical protein